MKMSHSHVSFFFKVDSISNLVECTSTLEDLAFWNLFSIGTYGTSSYINEEVFLYHDIMF